MKHLLILLLFISCKEKSTCISSTELKEKYGVSVFIAGEFYKREATCYIAKVVDPKDWSHNKYFTGSGYSTDPKTAFKVSERDSCQLFSTFVSWAIGRIIQIADSGNDTIYIHDSAYRSGTYHDIAQLDSNANYLWHITVDWDKQVIRYVRRLENGVMDTMYIKKRLE